LDRFQNQHETHINREITIQPMIKLDDIIKKARRLHGEIRADGDEVIVKLCKHYESLEQTYHDMAAFSKREEWLLKQGALLLIDKMRTKG